MLCCQRYNQNPDYLCHPVFQELGCLLWFPGQTCILEASQFLGELAEVSFVFWPKSLYWDGDKETLYRTPQLATFL